MPYQELTKGRVSIAGQLYAVTAVSHKRRPVFADFYCSRILVNTLREAHEQGHVNSLCWVVMPDHLHWLFELKQGYMLRDVMRLVKGRGAKRINEYLSGTGRFWQAGYYDHALRKEEDIVSIARYIVANPLRAGLVGSLRAYPHWDAVWL